LSAIKDLLSEEKSSEELVKNAERQAEDIVREARSKARELLKKAESDDARLNELKEQYQSRISNSKSKILEECKADAAQSEKTYQSNFDSAVKIIVERVLGAKQ
jgi:V/A-type H+/Na+-transporting ATPase subunit G/H